jgi:hypothetical protein
MRHHVAMRRTRLTALSLAALAAGGVVAVGGSPAQAEPTQSQALFAQKLLDDPQTSTGIKRMLKAKSAIVDPRSGFVDVTGDGRQDALVLVSTGGAAGAVGFYIFSTHGQPSSANDQSSLKPIFRLQSLHDMSLRLSKTSLSILEPKYAKGDDLCCPGRLRERDYTFDAKSVTFRRTADHDTAFTR